MSKGKFEVIRNLQKESVQFLLVPRSLQRGGVLLQWQRWCDTFAPFNEASSSPSDTINYCTFLEHLLPQLWMPRQPTPLHPTGSTSSHSRQLSDRWWDWGWGRRAPLEKREGCSEPSLCCQFIQIQISPSSVRFSPKTSLKNAPPQASLPKTQQFWVLHYLLQPPSLWDKLVSI